MLNAERLKTLRERAHLTQEGLAQALGCSKWTVIRLERGTRDAKSSEVEKLSRLLGVSVDYLMGRADEPRPPEQPPTEEVEHVPSSGKVLYVPIFELGSVCAGYGSGSYEMIADEVQPFPVELFGKPISADAGKAPYLIRVSGDSMTGAGIYDGSLVCVNPAMEIYDGDIAVVRLDGREFVKRVFWRRDGGGVLRSANPDYPPMEFTRGDIDRGDFEVLGRVTGTLTLL